MGFAVSIIGSSCLFDTKSAICENGMFCPARSACTAEQDGCHSDGCGDGVENGREECDDGNKANDDSCVKDCVKAKCGDGLVRKEVEECDDRNAETETCDYGEASCIVCDASCLRVEGRIAYCGDGVLQLPHEECDDGSNQCGKCNDECTISESARAVGRIGVVVAFHYRVSDNFVLYDGLNPPVTFRFVKGTIEDGFEAQTSQRDGNIEIFFGNGTSAVRISLIRLINNSGFPLLIEASVDALSDNGINLVHSRHTKLGNQSIAEHVSDSEFMVVGMNGGERGDCSLDDRCIFNEDCKSNICLPAKICGCELDVDCPGMSAHCSGGVCIP
jgi:cysteine-rich repeat protein